MDDFLVCKFKQTGSHGAASAAPLTPTLPHQIRAERGLSSVPTMAQAAPSTPTSYTTVAHKHRRKEIQVRRFCSPFFPSGSQFELGRTLAQDLSFPPYCQKNYPCRAQEKEDRSSIICFSHYFHSLVVCKYFLHPNSRSCQPEDTTTSKGAVYRTSLVRFYPTYPSKIVPELREGLVDHRSPRKNCTE